jgi:hypothetical protein
MSTRVNVYLHSDVAVPGCDCGERDWVVELPDGWMWSTAAGPGSFETMQSAMGFAVTLHPRHRAVQRSLTPDMWDLTSGVVS